MGALRLNAIYAAAQTVLLAAYGGVFALDRSPRLLAAEPWRAVGLACCAAGLALMVLAFGSLWPVIQIAPHPREGGRLITSGVYSRLRHPIYTAIVLITLGLFLRKPTPAVVAATAFVAAFLVVKSTYEERLLAARYPEYGEYRRRTSGVIPFLT